MTIRNATREEFRAIAGREAPAAWFGMVEEGADGIRAMGSIEWHANAADPGAVLAWATFDRLGRVSGLRAHRQIRRVLAQLRELDEPAIYCVCSGDAKAVRWLGRLGFARDPAQSEFYGAEVYRWA